LLYALNHQRKSKEEDRQTEEFDARFEVFTAVKIQVQVYWVLTPCSVVVGYRRFGGYWCVPATTLRVVTTVKTSK
jgi:hypothetical protein